MCKAIDEMREESHANGLKEGLAEGRNERSKEMAVALLKEKIFTSDKIAELTQLTVQEVQQLKEQITAHS